MIDPTTDADDWWHYRSIAAHLEPAHEPLVNREIAAMGITRVVIAHRQETIAAADRVVRLVEGRIT